MATGASTALQRFELENDVRKTSSADDALFFFNREAGRAQEAAKPWRSDPHYFKHVRVSALALVKMTMHCRSGGNLEVMGVMQGKVVGDTFIVLDSFALPVEGTETRVNAGADANEYMVQFLSGQQACGRPENLVGWYHSHPGYGCWMSGIDCSTQIQNQKYQDPFLAIIIDPIRTCAAGKVEIGAFRTFPEGYKPPEAAAAEYQTIPLAKIEDFGVHANAYYSLDVSFFKSSLDAAMLELLWNRYWVNTLSSCPLVSNREFVGGQVADLASKLEAVDAAAAQHGGGGLGGRGGLGGGGAKGGAEESAVGKAARDATKATLETAKGLGTQIIKDMLFNRVGGHVSVAMEVDAA